MKEKGSIISDLMSSKRTILNKQQIEKLNLVNQSQKQTVKVSTL